MIEEYQEFQAAVGEVISWVIASIPTTTGTPRKYLSQRPDFVGIRSGRHLVAAFPQAQARLPQLKITRVPNGHSIAMTDPRFVVNF
jgi:hypothetical protein